MESCGLTMEYIAKVRIETLRQTLATLSHHINNALTVIAGNAELCDPDDPASCKKLVLACQSETKRISAVLEALKKMVREAETRTTGYAELPDAMFDVESTFS